MRSITRSTGRLAGLLAVAALLAAPPAGSFAQPEPQEDVTTLSDVIARAPDEVPVPEVGEPTPLYTVADMEGIVNDIHRLHQRRCIDPTTIARAREALAATQAAQTLRREAARGLRTPAEVEAGELARQAAMRAYLGERRPGVPSPPRQFRDLRLEGLAARERQDTAGRFILVSGAVRNPRRQAIPTPPLQVTTLDRAGLRLQTVIADPSLRLFGHRIRGGEAQTFAYEFRDPPGATQSVSVTFGPDTFIPMPRGGCAVLPRPIDGGGGGRRRGAAPPPPRIAPLFN